MLSESKMKRIDLLKKAKEGRENPELGEKMVNDAKEVDRISYGGNLDKTIDNCIAKYSSSSLTKEQRLLLKNDVWKSRILNLVDPDEYFLYGFQELDENERYKFVGNREKESLCALINEKSVSDIFMDKWETYQHFKKFYGRDVMHITSAHDKNDFVNYVEENKKVLVKNARESQGRGIFKTINSKESIAESWTEIEKILDRGGSVVVEQFLSQASEMSGFNPSSVNTVRIATFRKSDEVKVMFTFARFGRKGSIVDNGGCGGVIVPIDKNTGNFNSLGRDENGVCYQFHPDSKIRFDNFIIPEWNSALELAIKLSGIVPQQLYVGWDLAYTENGWIMIEGNSWSQFIGPQVTLKQGMRDEIENTFYNYINELLRNEGIVL